MTTKISLIEKLADAGLNKIENLIFKSVQFRPHIALKDQLI